MTDLIKAADALACPVCGGPVSQDVHGQVWHVSQARESADGVKVKPLVWEAISDTSFRAKALMFGNVRVETYGSHWVINWSAPGYCDTLIAGEFDTPEAAKAAAQADYEARIKAALED